MSLLALLVLAQVQFMQDGVNVNAPVSRVNCGTNVTCAPAGRTAVTITAASGSGGAGYDGGKVGAAYMADASITAQTSSVAYSSDASYYSVTSTIAGYSYSSDASYYSTSFATNPADCTAGTYATTISAVGDLSCSAVEANSLSGTLNGAHGGLGSAQPTCSAGQFLTCNGTSCSCASSTTVNYASNGSDTPISVNVTDPGTSLVSKTLTVAANDTIIVEVFADVLNNSGTTATYTMRCRIGSTTVAAVSDSTTQAASATTRGAYRFMCVFAVRSSSSTRLWVILDRAPTSAANTTQTGASRLVWNTSASNFTGSQTFGINLSSSTATATQQAIVTAYRITQQTSNP